MPSLEFNGHYAWDTQHFVKPHEMTWSVSEFNKPSTIEKMEKLQEERVIGIWRDDWNHDKAKHDAEQQIFAAKDPNYVKTEMMFYDEMIAKGISKVEK